ncbi:MAG: nucleotidyltransferase domain-containing protein [Pseudomonadota bacterium]
MASAADIDSRIDDEAIVRSIREVLPDLEAIYRHGSSVTGRMRPGSDVDIAILTSRPVDADQLLSLYAGIEGVGDHDLDVILLAQAGPVAQFEVLSNNVLLYERNNGTRPAFEMRAVREYQDYLLRTRPIFQELRASGWPIH